MQKSFTTFKVGDRVKSHYRSRWIGIIKDIEYYKHYTGNRTYEGFIATVSIEFDRNGYPLRKPKLTRLNVDWLTLDPLK
jgi:hypothetical protein